MGDVVGGADLDRDPVDALGRVSSARGLEAAGGCVVLGDHGGGLGLVGPLGRQVQRVEPEADGASEEDEEDEADHQGEGRGQVEGAAQGVHQG
ncbi:hypothetical protein D3C86_1727320 [compost metagenome]